MARSGWLNTVYVSKPVPLVTAPPLTMACFFNPSLFSGSDNIPMCVGGTADANMLDLQVPIAVKQAWAESGAASTYSHSAETQTAMVVGTWYHIAAVFASNTSRLVYRNGVAGTLDTTSIAITPANLTQTFVGKSPSSGNNASHGSIAWAGFWNIDLSASDIMSLSQGRSPKRVRPGNIIGCPLMTGAVIAEVDPVSLVWTIAGAITETANPPIYF